MQWRPRSAMRGVFLAEGAEGTETQDKRIMDEKISPIERQLEYLLNKADEFQTQLFMEVLLRSRKKKTFRVFFGTFFNSQIFFYVLVESGLQNYGFAHIVPMFLQTCQPYFTYLESTARNSNPFRPPLSTYIRAQVRNWLIMHILCHKLQESTYLLYLYPITAFAVFLSNCVLVWNSWCCCTPPSVFFSLEESDPLRYKPIINHRQNLGRYINEGEDSEGTDPLLAQKEGLILVKVGFHIGIFLLLLLFYFVAEFYYVSFFTVSLTSILASGQIDNMKLSVFRTVALPPFSHQPVTGLYKTYALECGATDRGRRRRRDRHMTVQSCKWGLVQRESLERDSSPFLCIKKK